MSQTQLYRVATIHIPKFRVHQVSRNRITLAVLQFCSFIYRRFTLSNMIDFNYICLVRKPFSSDESLMTTVGYQENTIHNKSYVLLNYILCFGNFPIILQSISIGMNSGLRICSYLLQNLSSKLISIVDWFPDLLYFAASTHLAF